MTREETVTFMGIIKATYPRFYDGGEYMDQVIGIWYNLLQDYPIELALKAFEMFASKDDKGYPPVVGQIIHAINEIQRPEFEMLSEGEVWGLVKRALSNGAYHSKTEFDKLPRLVQRAVGSPELIYRWSLMDEEMVDNSIRNMVCRSYKALAEAERELQALPPSLRQHLDGLKAPNTAWLPDPDNEPRQALEAPDSGAQEPRGSGFQGKGFERFMEAIRDIAEKAKMDEEERGKIEIVDPDAEARWETERKAEWLRITEETTV